MQRLQYKICIFGDGGVGKTTLVNRYLTGVFKHNYKITIGADFYLKQININDLKITLQIWDFGGEDRFRFVFPSYLVGSNGCIFMFDITRFSSIQNVKEWMQVFKKGAKQHGGDIPIIIVGSKLDLNNSRTVSREIAHEIVTEHNFLDYIECSAKTGENVEEIFLKITDIMMEKGNIL